MTEAQRDSFVEDKLTCEKHLELPERLLNAVRKVLAEKDLNSLLQIVADASRDLTGARYITTGHGYVNGVFIAGGSSRSVGAKPCPTGKEFNVEKGGVYLSLIREKESIRLTDAEMRSHPAWWGLPEDHVPLRGLLGVRLIDVNGLPNGLIMASDKENGGDFTAEDETILSQLAAMVSLALQHIEARMEAENEKLRLEAVMEALPVGMAVTDVNGGQIKSNSAFEKIWGVQRPPVRSIGDYAAYKAWWADTGKLVEPDEWASVQAVKTGKPAVEQVMEIQQFDGTRRFIINSGAPIRDASNNIVGSSVAIQDITERKRAEEALSQSEARYRVLVETSPDAVVVHKDGRLLYANSAALRLYGAETFEQLQERNILDLLHPDDREQITARVRHVIEGGKTPLRESRIIKLDGTQVSVEATGGPIDYQGERAVQAIIRDITERKQADDALRESETRFRFVLENSLDAAYRRNLRADRYDYMSPVIEQIAGFSAEEMSAMGIDAVLNHIHPDDRSPAASEIEHAIETGWGTLEYRFRCKDSQYRWLSDRFTVTRDKEGKPLFRGGTVRDITDRKMIEEALRESEKTARDRLAEIEAYYNTAPIGLCIFDTNLRYIRINERLAEINGLPAAEHLGRTIREIVPTLADQAEKLARQVMDSGQPARNIEFTGETVAQPGVQRTWLESWFPLKDASGQITGINVVAVEITERKQMEKELELVAHLPQENPDSVIRLSQGRIISYANPAAKELLRPWGCSVGQEAPAKIADLAITAIGNGIRHEVDVSYGERRYLLNLVPFTNADYINLYARDITERKMAEEALRQNEERLALALSAGRLATWDWLMAADEIIWNDEAFRMLGYRPGEVKPDYQAWIDRVHPDDRFKAEAVFARSLESGCDFTNEFRALWPDGTVRWIESRGHLDRDDKGQPLRSFGAMIDMTERKEAERQLIKDKDLLEQKVQERTADLLKAKEAAEAAAKAKSEFMANMSHEIRTPMNAIIGMTELILDEPMDPVQRENLELVRTNGDSLLSIINDILDFSKMESDKLVLEEYEFNLRSCVEEALDLVALKASDKGLTLACIIDNNVPENIIGDPGRLRQVMGNLLSNAVKFTDEGEVTVSVSSKETDGTNEIHFSVQDTGIGIPQGSMHQLFQHFNQMEPSTTRLYGGTGLGLAISRKLAELMGGKIWAQSEEGKGSTFHFTIKVPSGGSRTKTAAVLPQMIGRQVLIVEDNKTNRRILSKQVYDCGMIPIAATTGREALKYIQRGDDFDVAILDMDLQDMNGLELEEEMRKYNNTLPLVLLISLGKKIPKNHAYLTKPIKRSQLYNVLKDVLPKEPAKRPIQQGLAGQPTQNHAPRILLAEDNISHQKVAQQMLRKLGYKADIVANGMEVLHSLERQHYDIVFMDVKMPVMDGLEATRIIRQRWPNGPKIIAITAYALKGDREKFIAAGMNDYISKPIQKEDLAQALKRYHLNDQ